MFGQSKPVRFDPYGRRRSRFRLPRWLALLLIGVAIGAAGVVVVQERYLPPRLSADASVRLRNAYEQADSERARLKGQLGDTTKRLDAALADTKSANDEAAGGRAAAERMRDDVSFLVASLPPGSHAGAVDVRAGRFSVKGGSLTYDVVFTREGASGKRLSGVMQLVVAGESARGTQGTTSAKPVAVSIGSQEIVHGSLPLPDGFKARQVTIQVLDRIGGKPLGMRVMLVT